MNPNRKLRRFHRSFLPVALAACAVLGSPAPAQQPGTSPVKIYLMIGQSNMQGHGEISPVGTPGTLEYIVANDPGTDYQFLVDGGGNWVVRDDVWIRYERDGGLRTGDLEPGYGASAANTTIGPELGFGHRAGTTLGNQVLLVKASWGGRSLGNDFLPPSSGADLEAARSFGDPGFYYKETLRLLEDAVANLATHFPDYDGQGYEIAGICWHQGWNDRVTSAFSAAYETNMANFINDIRSDLGVPGLPFVIATTGMGDPADDYTEVEEGQLAMEDFATYPEFDGNVAVIDTRKETYNGDTYQQDIASSPTSQSHHWNRNARTYLHIGLAMGDVMPTLTPPRCPSRLLASSGSGGVTLTWQNGSEMPTNVQILRDGVEIEASAPVTATVYTDSTALPGEHVYELVFTMSGDPCDPLTVTHDSGISGLSAYRSQNGVVLNWTNNLGYAAIEVRRGGVLIEPSLSGSATSYEDTGAPASGLVTYSLVPTTGTSTPAEVEINLGPVIAGYAAIYEPFDLPAGSALDGGAGGPGLGTWSGGGGVDPTSLEFGELPIAGNRFTGGGNVASWAGISTTLSSAGLLDHGAELWFSVLLQPGSAANDYGFLGLSSATGNIGANFGSVPSGANVIGIWLQNGSDLQLVDAVDGTPVGGRDGVKSNLSLDVPALVVGKFTWGADGASPDTLQIYLPGIDLAQPASNTGATLTTVIDQSTFSHLGLWMRNANSRTDEIRFGASYDDVIGAGIDTADDFTPPTPAQMSWASPPTAVSDTVISMTAVTAGDDNGVEYQFTRYLGGGVDAASPWQSSAAYTDAGLSPSTTYAYTVQARDRSVNQNTNAASSPATEATTFVLDTTPPPVPSLVTPLGPVTATEITVSANPVVDGEGNGVQYRFHNTTLATDSGWLTDPTWTETGLDPETTYAYTVQARDTSANLNESAASTAESATTLPPGGAGGALIYEPFDMTVGLRLSGQSGGTGLGTWDAGTGEVASGSMSYGTLPTSGNKFTGGGNVTSWAGIGTSLSGAGLLEDGAELWFSVLLQPASPSNEYTFIGLSSETGTIGSNWNSVPTGANAVGIWLQNGSDLDLVYAVDGTPSSRNRVQSNLPLTTPTLVVCKYTWGATALATDLMEIYLPGTDLALPAVKDSSTMVMDQSTLSDLGIWMRNVNDQADEIRFGASYEDVIGAGGSGGSAFETWATGGETFAGDANGDGVADGLAFLLGAATPGTNALGLLPTPGEDGSGGLVMSFTMLDPSTSAPAVLSISHSGDLGITDPWSTPVAVPATSDTVGGINFVVSGSGTLDVTATIPAAGNALGGKLFGRLVGNE